MFWTGRKVFITGHTGFKGSWLSLWLELLGAEVAGYALQTSETPNLFQVAEVGRSVRSTIGDICDAERLKMSLSEHQPEIVFHLAAQPLVRYSYVEPLETYRVNVLGTGSLLEAVRGCDSVRAVVVITTDKCYENREWAWPYRENDRLGGYDPYSSSKACAELVVSSWQQSFFPAEAYDRHKVAIASARAGNVIGGGDWSAGRLIPDVIRAFAGEQPLVIRNPHAIRPWQHVLEPLRGYLMLAERLYNEGAAFTGAWNFGPEYRDAKPVEWIVQHLATDWGTGARWELDKTEPPHEAQMLRLDWSKAFHELRWSPVLPLEQALAYTVDWYHAWRKSTDMRMHTLRQIEQYTRLTGECV
jgi:CDP-glucose 4,6-dehydratase